MDESNQGANKFENVFKESGRKKTFALYSHRETKPPTGCRSIKPRRIQDIINNVNLKIKNIQKADLSSSSKKDINNFDKYKKSSFLPVNILRKELKVEQKPNKFDSEFVSDTQLINVIENAEAMLDTGDGITQEFNNAFFPTHDKTKTIKNPLSSVTDLTANNEIIENATLLDRESNLNKNNIQDSLDKELLRKNNINTNIQRENNEEVLLKYKGIDLNQEKLQGTLEDNVSPSPIFQAKSRINNIQTENCAEVYHKYMEIDENQLKFVGSIEDNISPSPIFQVKSRTTSPIVVDLKAFENFERIALPIIEAHNDMSLAKQLINSQIIGRELFIHTDSKCHDYDIQRPTSPVLYMDTEKLHIKQTPELIELIDKPKNKDSQAAVTEKYNTTFLEDEILFSSDEEEYIEKEIQDVPLTCALETSFYEQPSMLDKTMYVGFQTASNRSIQINTESFSKAKHLLDEVEQGLESNTNLSLLVDSLSKKYNASNENTINFCNQTNNTSTKEENVDFVENNSITKDVFKSENFIEAEIETIKRPEKRKFDGFMTASEKKIKLSDLALARCKKVFHDINFEDNCDLTNDIEKEVCNLSQIDEDILKEFSHDMSLVEENKIASMEGFGFKTASNKNIKISETALAKTKNVFEGIDISTDQLNEATTSQDLIKPKDLKDPSPKPPGILNPLCIGFKTASNRDIKISKEALAKSKQFFVENEFDEINQDVKPCGNQTVDNDNYEFLGELSDKDSNFIGNIKPEINLGQFSNEIEGKYLNTNVIEFRTANNKHIQVSDLTLSKTKDIETEYIKSVNDDSEVKEIMSEEFHENMHEDLNAAFENDVFDIDKEILTLQGPLQNPEKSSKNTGFHDNDKYKDVFAKESVIIKKFNTDVNLYNETNTTNSPQRNNSLSSQIKSNNTDTATRRSKNIDIETFHKSGSKNINTNKGFQTADGKCIKISANALAKSKVIFQDIDDPEDDQNTKRDTLVAPFEGFKTANNKPIRVSAEALNKCKEWFQDLDGIELNEKNVGKHSEITSSFKGFQTANNKLITVSSKASAQSRALLKDIDNENKENTNDNLQAAEILNSVNGFEGFQTGNKNPVHISNEALAKSKALLENIDHDVSKNVNDLQNKTPEFEGFKTANKTVINVSDSALAKSRELFKDIDNENEKLDLHITNKLQTTSNEMFQNVNHDVLTDVNDFQNKMPKFEGFTTANRKIIKVSDSALAKSRALFKDDVKLDLNRKNESPFKGFQTANNNAIKVSDNALLISERLLEDIYNLNNTEYDIKSSKFEGFKTGNNKNIKISNDALVKSKQIFQDISQNEDTSNPTTTTSSRPLNKQISDIFKTGNNNDVKVSEEALKMSKKALSVVKNDSFTDLDKLRGPLKGIKPRHEIETLIDTQVINNFEETLYTEDFCKETTPRRSKISGSPILSCPKAKRRKKFETPYRNDGKWNTVHEITPVISKQNTILFNEEYKKSKRYNLKDLAEVELKSKTNNKDPYILNFSMDNLLDFEFLGIRNHISDGQLTIEDLKDYFSNRVNKKLIPNGWLDNHLRLIIWKLISYELKFPNTLSTVCTAKNVLEQLKYRYDRELYNAERPALRKILEKDDSASRSMILCVAGIYIDGIAVQSVANMSSNVELLLTDGWYYVKACIDQLLTKCVCEGKVKIGCKIIVNGAELMNCDQGIAPWEDTSGVRLKIFGNSTRRARWDSRLGYHGNAAILSRLSSVKPEGGKVSKLRLYVARVYPMLYVEKFEDGSTVTRSEKLEHIHQLKYENEKQTAMEKLYEEVEKEISDRESQDSSGSQFVRIGNTADLPITESQTKLLEERSHIKRERMIQNVQDRVRKKIEERGLNVGRNVVTLMKVRVAEAEEIGGKIQVTKGFLSIWKPSGFLTEIVKEDCWIEAMNVVPTAVRYNEIQLSAGRQAVFSQSTAKLTEKISSHAKSLRRKCYHIKELAQNPTIATDYNEIDTVGYIFQIDELNNQPFQNMYLTDTEKNIICVNFWGGLKKFGFHTLEVGQIVCGINLQRRAGNTRKSVPQFRVTEFSYFTKTPKNVAGRTLIEEMEKSFSGLNRIKFCEDCVKVKNCFLNKFSTENVSPYRFQNDHNLSKTKVFVESPLAKCEENLNLTGLDFESTFKQTDSQALSPIALERKRKVNAKIAKLKMVGEPPALSPIHIINKSKVTFNSYRSPLAQNVASVNKSYQNSSTNANDISCSPIITNNNTNFSKPSISPIVTSHKSSSVNAPSSNFIPNNVASTKKSYQNKSLNDDITSSPVFSMNRTYVKNVNPVKLNFSNVQDISTEDVDAFAEEFDGSPPLSLD